MASVRAGSGDPLRGASGPGSSAQGAAREPQLRQMGGGNAWKRLWGTRVSRGQRFALVCELHSAVIQSPALSLGLVQNIKQLRSLFFFFSHWKLGLSDRSVCSKPSYFHQDISGLLVAGVCVRTGFANQNPIFPISLL